MSSSPFAPLVRLVNAAVSALAKAPVVGRFVSRGITEITYVGRRTGRTFRTPVGYRRSGDDVLIGVEFPDAKTWWRNFLGDGGPLTLTLDGTDRTGHAVTTRDDQGRVSVRVRLDA
ncbi:nitroreductase/quinone reductase family protein [Pseudonocardia benzenivorans]